jgi:hypothetical protein
VISIRTDKGDYYQVDRLVSARINSLPGEFFVASEALYADDETLHILSYGGTNYQEARAVRDLLVQAMVAPSHIDFVVDVPSALNIWRRAAGRAKAHVSLELERDEEDEEADRVWP